MTVRIGISGWRYEGWRGVFYPTGWPQREELAFASRAFDTIEINGSFYGLLRPQHYDAWYAETPPGFVLAVKAPRYITHVKRLRDVDRALANFFASGVLRLREKMGPLLWQLPPNFEFDAERIDGFLRLLPRDSQEEAAALARRRDSGFMKGRTALAVDAPRRWRHAIEVRHDSFITPRFIELLHRHGVAVVVADTAGKWPWIEDVTADFVYLRLHGHEELYASGYSDAALSGWARRIGAWHEGSQPGDARLADGAGEPSRRPRDVFAYFDNDAKVHAPFDAAALRAMLRLPPLEHTPQRRHPAGS